MGARYLTDLADVVRGAGLVVVEVDGWQTRARGSGGYNPGLPNHVMVHHTASGPSSDGWPDVDYCTFGDDDAPLTNLYLARDGAVYVCAAGATNTNGTGADPCGLIGDDTMNTSALGIEAGNDGVGERWPTAQTSAYTVLCTALCAAYRIPSSCCHSHAEWAPGRKTDPAGPSPWATSGTWVMDAFRADLTTDAAPTPPDPAPTPRRYRYLEGDDMPATLIVDDTLDNNYFALSPHAITWLWDADTLAYMQRDGTLTGDGLHGAQVVPWQTVQHYIDMAWTGGDRVPTGYHR